MHTSSNLAPPATAAAPAGPLVAIVNAGAGRDAARPAALEAAFRRHGLAVEVRLAQDGAELERLARAALARRPRLLVAGGGDGTIALVAGLLADSGLALGVLPLGTFNHFARDLGLPLELDAAVAVIARGAVRTVDAGEVNGRLFLNNSSLGIHPDFVRYRDAAQHRLGWRKWPAALLATVRGFRHVRFLRLGLELDGRRIARETPFLAVGNNAYALEAFRLGGRPRLDGGELGLYIGHRLGPFALFRMVLRTLLGGHQQGRDFEADRVRELVVHSRRKRLRVSTDGEVLMLDTPLRYRSRPGCLRVVVGETGAG